MEALLCLLLIPIFWPVITKMCSKYDPPKKRRRRKKKWF